MNQIIAGQCRWCSSRLRIARSEALRKADPRGHYCRLLCIKLDRKHRSAARKFCDDECVTHCADRPCPHKKD